MQGYQLLLKHILRSGMTSDRGHEIVYRDLVRYDYPTLEQRVARLAGGLSELGLRPGDTVGVLDWDSHRYLESYFAIPGIGAVLHMVNVRLSPEQILYTINHANDRALLVHTDFLPMLEGIWDRIEHVRIVIVMSDDPEAAVVTSVPVTMGYEALLAAADPCFQLPDLDENTRATTFYTTGTTGLPKGVFFSHRQLVLHTMATVAALATSAEHGRLVHTDVYMPITPMFHVHAWGLPFVATMLGLKQVYPGRYAPKSLLGLQQREGVTLSHCVPTILQILLSSAAAENRDFWGWKMIIGGSALPRDLAQQAFDCGIDVFAGYGMSETCPILTLSRLAPERIGEEQATEIENRTRAGIPVPLVDLRIADQAANPLPRGNGVAGEVVVRAPWLTEGYTGDPAASEALWHGGWLHTGDIGVLRSDGTLQITDRIKDVVKTGGEWISSLEIEDLLLTHPGVREAAVIGIADQKWGERPLAIVVGTSSPATEVVLQAHLQQFCDRGELSKWAVPSRILFLDELPKTSVGKIDKKVLRVRHGDG